MSYQAGWGFEASDSGSLSMGKIEAAESSHLPTHCPSPSTFVVQFRVSKLLVDLCNTGAIHKFTINSDYEQSSAIQISRYLQAHLEEACIVIPAIYHPTFTVIARNSNDMAMIVKLCKQLNYNVVSTPGCCSDMPEDTNYLRQYVLASVLHHLMRQCGYRVFATEDQAQGVLAKTMETPQSSSNETQLYDVIAIRNCVMNDRSEVFMTVECFCFKVIPFDAIMSETADPVVVQHVLSTLKTSSNRASSAYLTEYDRQCRARGYNQYLPDHAESFALYWDLLYGISWREGEPVAHIVGGEGGAAGRGEVGERMVPLQALCRGVSEVSSKTKQCASEIVQRFLSALSAVPRVYDVSLIPRREPMTGAASSSSSSSSSSSRPIAPPSLSLTSKNKKPFQVPSQRLPPPAPAVKRGVQHAQVPMDQRVEKESGEDDLLFVDLEVPTPSKKRTKKGK